MVAAEKYTIHQFWLQKYVVTSFYKLTKDGNLRKIEGREETLAV